MQNADRKEEKWIKLRNFQVREQMAPSSCGYAAISMISSFFGNPIEEEEIPKHLLYRFGLTPSQFVRKFEKCLPDYSMEIKTMPEEAIVDTILKQLRNGLPVPILYSTVNPFGKLEMHYSVAIGMDKQKTKVLLANPFGYEETLETRDMLDKMAFRNFTDRPLPIRIALWFGTVRRNTVLLIGRRNTNDRSNTLIDRFTAGQIHLATGGFFRGGSG